MIMVHAELHFELPLGPRRLAPIQITSWAKKSPVSARLTRPATPHLQPSLVDAKEKVHRCFLQRSWAASKHSQILSRSITEPARTRRETSRGCGLRWHEALPRLATGGGLLRNPLKDRPRRRMQDRRNAT